MVGNELYHSTSALGHLNELDSHNRFTDEDTDSQSCMHLDHHSFDAAALG